MSRPSPLRRVRHLKRYQEIARILIKHGFGDLVDRLDLLPYLSLPRRLLRREPALHISLPERLWIRTFAARSSSFVQQQSN